ncbi:hypothetical protein AAG906_031599 [Vitis piasezkii]
MSLGRRGRGKIVRLFQETLRARREREAVILTRRTQSQPTKWHFVSCLPFHLSPVEIWSSENLQEGVDERDDSADRSMLYWPVPNVLYVVGYALDRFAEGLWALQPVHQNTGGLVLDATIEGELRLRHLQVADATRASLGLPVLEYIVTDTPLLVEKWVDPKSGQSTGRIKHPDSLPRAVQTLVNRTKVNAVAVTWMIIDKGWYGNYILGIANFLLFPLFPYVCISFLLILFNPQGIDDLAGVEAVISHLVVKEFQIPCAHAPALSPFPLSLSLCPKSAAEEVSNIF